MGGVPRVVEVANKSGPTVFDSEAISKDLLSWRSRDRVRKVDESLTSSIGRASRSRLRMVR